MDVESPAVKASLETLERAGVLKAQPLRSRRLMLDWLSLVEAHLPPELFVLLREQQENGSASPGESSLEARLACWKHLEACACYGSGVEAGAVRALLMLLEQTNAADAARLADFARLVSVCRPEVGSVTSVLRRTFPELETLESHVDAS